MSFEPAIDLHGRWSFLVDSESRPGIRHIVDLEPELDIEGNPVHGGEPWWCSCEAHHYKVTRPCKHVIEVMKFIGPIIKFLKATTPNMSPRKIRGDTKSYQLDHTKKYEGNRPRG
jgi:hypothetical protein